MSVTRVLLVEDNRADARLVAELLAEVQEQPFSLTVVGTLAEAISGAPDHDVVVLDLSLPDSHGLPTLERMVSAARTIPIVVLTGNDDERAAMEAVKTGAQDYLLKAEMTPSLVARSLRYAIERKRVESIEVARAKSDQSAARARFVATVTAEVTLSLDLEVVPRSVARLLVPMLGDVSAIYLLREDGCISRVAYAGSSSVPDTLASEVAASVPDAGRLHSPVLEAIERRVTVLLTDWGGTTTASQAVEGAGVNSAEAAKLLVTPLLARGRVLGAIACAMGPSGRRFLDDDRLMAEEIAAQVALAIDNVRLYRQAQRAVRARDEILAIVSHDLRNPMGVLSLTLAMLDSASERQRTEGLARARRALSRMERLINDLLDVARIDAGTLRVSAEVAELRPVLDDAFELHRPLAVEKGIEMVRDYKEDLGMAMIDRDRIAQVLGNLLGNALKFTPSGGTVCLRAERSSTGVTIRVSDSGPGISRESLLSVFDRFWQQEQRSDGVGLGLAIAKGIVDAHGGSISVESTPGEGSCFEFVLPAPMPTRSAVMEVAS